MINGFKEQTHHLTENELEYVPFVIEILKTARGKESTLNSAYILFILETQYNVDLSAPRLRKIVNHIRVNFLIKNLLANSKGYWISNDYNEIMDYQESLDQRIAAIQAVRDSLTA